MGLIPVYTGSSKWSRVLQHHSKFYQLWSIKDLDDIFFLCYDHKQYRLFLTDKDGRIFNHDSRDPPP